MDDMDRAQLLRDRLQTIDAAIQEIQVTLHTSRVGYRSQHRCKSTMF